MSIDSGGEISINPSIVIRGFLPYLLIIASLCWGGFARAAEFGQLDEGFAPELAPVPGELGGLAQAPSGKYFVWGQFHQVGVARRINLARMNADGTVDETFNAGLSALSSISKISVQADGAVLVMGTLFLADGTVLPNVVRFLPTGALDESFQLPENIGLIYSFTLIPASQKILLNGLLLPTNNIANAVLLRLESNGSIDASFNSAVLRGAFNLIQPLSEGKLLVEGYLSLSHGLGEDLSASLSAVNMPAILRELIPGPRPRRIQLWRLNEDGSFDDTFSSAEIPDSPVTPGPQDVMYRGSARLSAEGNPNILLKRYLANGENDAAFTPVFEPGMRFQSMAPLSTGKILVLINRTNVLDELENVILRLGNDGHTEAEYVMPNPFYIYPFDMQLISMDNGTLFINRRSSHIIPQDQILRLQDNGTVQAGFGAPFQIFGTATLRPQRDGKIYLRHAITNTEGMKLNTLSRLEKSGSIDAGFAPPRAEIGSPVILENGDIIAEISPIGIYESALVRLSPSGEVVRGLTNEWINPWADSWVAFPDGRVAVARSYTFDAPENEPYIRFYTAQFQTELELTAPENEYLPDISLKLTADGKLLATGVSYISNEDSFYAVNYVERFLPEGQPDSSFQLLTNRGIYALPHVTDNVGRIYLFYGTFGGAGSNGGSVPENDLPPLPTVPPLQRYLADGTKDFSFNPLLTLNSSVDEVWPQKDGRILIAGRFYSADGKRISTLRRLLPDGGVDETFIPPAGEVVPITTIAVEADGNVLIGGAFDQIGGQPRAGLARLKSVEQAQVKNLTITGNNVTLQLGGNLGRTWLIQTSPDLQTWTTVSAITTGIDDETVELAPPDNSGKKFYRAVLAP